MVAAEFALFIVAAAFLPPLVFLAYVRHQEKIQREPWSAVLGVFMYGAIVSVLIALALEGMFDTTGREYDLLQGQIRVPGLVVLVVVVAPLVEEFAKGLGVRNVRRRIFEEEDGIVYGAAAGFGFSATENLFYEVSALLEGGETAYVATAVVRTFTGCFLHATASGILGYGMARRYLHQGSFLDVVPYYALAVLLHALFNLIAVLAFALAVGLILVIAFLGMQYTVRKIRRLDAEPTNTWGRGSR